MVTHAERCHDAVKIVIAVLALSHNREGEVHLSRSVNLNPMDAPSTNASATSGCLPWKCSQLARRSRWLFLDAARAEEAARPVAAILAAELGGGFDAEASAASFARLAESYRLVP